MITIPKNDYIQPTIVREKVVQDICEAFLANNTWTTFHPSNDGRRKATLLVLKRNNKAYGFHDTPFLDDDETVKFNGAEMKAAFKELIKAGYYIFKEYTYGTWKGYLVRKKPYYEGGEQVTEFNDFID